MLSTSKVAILDYGAGNIASVNRFFASDLECNTNVVTVEDFNGKDWEILIIPGVGHFGAAAKRLESAERHEQIKGFAEEGKLIIGICLGAQILTLGSEEADPGDKGIGLIPMYCRSLKRHPIYEGKIPRTGWAMVEHENNNRAAYYFVHSYYLSGSSDPKSLVRVDECLEDKVTAYVSMNGMQVHAIQFHPEKSGLSGFMFVKRILENA
jgi:glutamine amidotransferase